MPICSVSKNPKKKGGVEMPWRTRKTMDPVSNCNRESWLLSKELNAGRPLLPGPVFSKTAIAFRTLRPAISGSELL